MNNYEHKMLDVEIKELTEDGSFTGYASVFNHVDLQDDVVEKGAFKRTLQANKQRKQKLKMLFAHDWAEPIGYFEDAMEDDKGLFVKGKLVLSVQRAREIYDLMKEGALDSMSIGYQVLKSKFDKEDEKVHGRPIRRITEVKLYEISIVSLPANELAVINNVKEYKEVSIIEKLYDALNLENKRLIIDEIYSLIVAEQLANSAVPDNSDLDGVLDVDDPSFETLVDNVINKLR